MPQVKTKAKSRAAHRGDVIIKLGSGPKTSEATVRFGSVEVRDATFSLSEKRRNVGTGQAALSRAVTKIVKPGFAKSNGESAPRYRADPHNPQVLIRELKGVSARGDLRRWEVQGIEQVRKTTLAAAVAQVELEQRRSKKPLAVILAGHNGLG